MVGGEPRPIFQIEDDDEDEGLVNGGSELLQGEYEDKDDLAMPETLGDTDPKQSLLHDTTNLVVGTAGCCGAVCFIYSCLCCGMCHDELVETYNHHTLFGRWCPM